MSIKIFELFAGIGAPRKALDNLGIEYESIGYSEIEKNAVKSYCAIHNETEDNNYNDITKMHYIDDDITVMAGGFPCKSVSAAGKRDGIIEGVTESGLMFDMMRIIKRNKPKYVITENVKELIGKRHKEQFDLYISSLEEMGYTSSYKILNGKDFGIPQNRNRVFIVSKLDTDEPFNFDNIETKETAPLSDFIDFEKDNDMVYEDFTENKKERLAASLECYKGTEEKLIVELNESVKFAKTPKDKNDIYRTLHTKGSFVLYDTREKTWRKASSKEHFKLMGFSDDDYNKASKVVSDAQLYKQAGNSIIVPILESIFKELLKNEQ